MRTKIVGRSRRPKKKPNVVLEKLFFLSSLALTFISPLQHSTTEALLSKPGCFSGPQVFITVSSIAKSKKGVLRDRLIEINWNSNDPEVGDWVGLFDKNPEEEGSSNPLTNNLLTWVEVKMPRGYLKTDHRLDRLPLDPDSPCLGYWIAYFRDEKIINTNCLKIYPNWMREHKDIIGDTPLYNLMIPGTHNSGSWRPYEGPNTDTVFLRYLVNQDEPVYRQLMHGIRYLDIRVGYYANSPERFWINHNFYRMHPLSSVIHDVQRFVEEYKEIVILDFHRFPVGFEGRRDRHTQLAEYLQEELSYYALPSSFWPNATPNDVWSANKSVIIAYSDTRTSQQYPILWPPLPQEWGDVRSLPELKEFIGEAIKKRGGKGQIWSAMAEFTPKPLDVVLRPTQGLRIMAQVVNIAMTYWFYDPKWYQKANVVASDFFLGNNLIQNSIITNLRGAYCYSSTSNSSTINSNSSPNNHLISK